MSRARGTRRDDIAARCPDGAPCRRRIDDERRRRHRSAIGGSSPGWPPVREERRFDEGLRRRGGANGTCDERREEAPKEQRGRSPGQTILSCRHRAAHLLPPSYRAAALQPQGSPCGAGLDPASHLVDAHAGFTVSHFVEIGRGSGQCEGRKIGPCATLRNRAGGRCPGPARPRAAPACRDGQGCGRARPSGASSTM